MTVDSQPHWEETKAQRLKLVELLRKQGIGDDRVLKAIATTPEKSSCRRRLRPKAYRNTALPIGFGQTISQPLVVAMMLQAASPRATDRVLEVGAGSGYVAALTGAMAADVFAIERDARFVRRARAESVASDARTYISSTPTVSTDGPRRLHLTQSSCPLAPAIPPALKAQLKIGGRMVIPLGNERETQQLVLLTHPGKDVYSQMDIAAVRFVPLVDEFPAKSESD